MRQAGLFLMIAGVALLLLMAWPYVDHVRKQHAALDEAHARLSEMNPIAKENFLTDGFSSAAAPSVGEPADPLPAVEFTAADGEVVGLLVVPKLDKELPLVEGADEESLAMGVGHVARTAYPGQGDQIVVSGHRDTVFTRFGELDIGDTFVVRMPYGDFEYRIHHTRIVSADDLTVIGPTGEEELVVTTCYPFHALAHATERFIFYAVPR
ncbi:class D sortase [Bhargavaea ullalensis]|uniref:Sortase A n=1 Tax=Bhargavaea ullalensis TaxID=1265685 RepID=A0ABV2GD49_9BACL